MGFMSFINNQYISCHCIHTCTYTHFMCFTFNYLQKQKLRPAMISLRKNRQLQHAVVMEPLTNIWLDNELHFTCTNHSRPNIATVYIYTRQNNSQSPYILGHNSKSVKNMESYDISVDTQSNFTCHEYYLHVLAVFLINPYIEYGTGAQTKKLQKVPVCLQPIFSDMVSYQSHDTWYRIWYTNKLCTDF